MRYYKCFDVCLWLKSKYKPELGILCQSQRDGSQKEFNSNEILSCCSCLFNDEVCFFCFEMSENQITVVLSIGHTTLAYSQDRCFRPQPQRNVSLEMRGLLPLWSVPWKTLFLNLGAFDTLFKKNWALISTIHFSRATNNINKIAHQFSSKPNLSLTYLYVAWMNKTNKLIRNLHCFSQGFSIIYIYFLTHAYTYIPDTN